MHHKGDIVLCNRVLHLDGGDGLVDLGVEEANVPWVVCVCVCVCVPAEQGGNKGVQGAASSSQAQAGMIRRFNTSPTSNYSITGTRMSLHVYRRVRTHVWQGTHLLLHHAPAWHWVCRWVVWAQVGLVGCVCGRGGGYPY
jgi:hypothetical protein